MRPTAFLVCAVLEACAHGGGAASKPPPGKAEPIELEAIPSDTVQVSRFPKAPKGPYRPDKGGRAWFVAPGGDGSGGSVESPMGNLRDAIDAAGKGDVVWVKGGSYKVGTSGDEFALRLKTDGVTVSAWPGQRAILTSAEEGVNYGVEITGDDIIFDGFDLQGFGQGGIHVGRLRQTEKNVIIAHVRVEGGQDGIRAAVRSGKSKQPLISGLLLYDVTITGAAIGFNCGEGPCNDVRLERLKVDGGEEDSRGEGSSGADAVAFEAGDNIAIVHSEVKNVGADGYDLKATRVLLYGSTVRGVGRNGIKLWNGGDIINCLVHGTGADAAIVFDKGASYRVIHTTVARHGRRENSYSLTMAYDHPRQPGKLEITNSIFWDNAGPIWVSGKTDLHITSSLFTRSRGGVEIVWGRKEELMIGGAGKPPSALSALGAGVGLIIGVEPGFVDPENHDYRLKPGAAACDKGARMENMPTHDLVGTPRGVGARRPTSAPTQEPGKQAAD